MKGVLQFIIGLIVLLFLSISGIANLLVEYLWFGNLGFSDIFMISLQTKILLFFVGFFSFVIFASINLWISSRLINTKNNVVTTGIKTLIVSGLGIFVGFATSANWFIFLQYFNQVPFNLKDPIFVKDVAFYVFSLPFFLSIWNITVSIILITAVLVALNYLQKSLTNLKTHATVQSRDHSNGGYDTNAPMPPQFDFKELMKQMTRAAMVHLALLGSMFFGLLTIKHYLARFSIMYSQKGIVVGAGYTDVMVYLPVMKILMVIAIMIAVLLLFWILFISRSPRLKKRHILFYAIAVYLLFFVIGGQMIPNIVQTLKVAPNEMNLERPYIENNINFTKIAYGLDEVKEQDFIVKDSITPEKLEAASKTIDNVRILDWRPLTQTYKQTQEMRLYYDLSGIDIDRYYIDGKYTQVMIAPRELDQNQITSNAKTWVNLHLVYSHGYGVVMSPVNKVTKQGLPYYLIQDIPPIYNVEEPSLVIDQPQVYYGEKRGSYLLVNTKTGEFDYPKGNTNEYTHYDGRGGVKLDSFGKKVLMALKFKDVKILLSSDVTAESRIQFYRHIQDRIQIVTPFLSLDADPYLVISEGKMYWMQDAYTMTGNFPYSEKYGNINYLRNSVKIVVDAYNGDITYYIVDTKDPLIMTYAKIFPKQFKLLSQMPDDLKGHIRYPEDLFKIQSTIYSTYHMDDPTVFYNKEDAWQIPNEVYGVGQKVTVEPYYMIMKLPDEAEEEFILMTSFTPIKKDNMVAWMAARSDGENYGNLLVYKFQKDKLIYGPLQIEAKIDQDSEISQQLTLWSQQGSQVTRGNLLVIPIDDSILYIEPLYIQAETGQLPELKRVLVSDGEDVVMEKDLATALEVLFGKSTTKKTDEDGLVIEDDLILQANTLYSNILDSMKESDWTGIGNNLDRLGKVLMAMKE